MFVELLNGVVGGKAVEETARLDREAHESRHRLVVFFTGVGMVDRELEGFVEQALPAP